MLIKPGYSVGPSARSVTNLTPMDKNESIPVASEMSVRSRGVDIGNGYKIGYKELKSLSNLQKAGIDTGNFFAEPKVKPKTTWTLRQQIVVMENRRHKSILEKKNALLQRNKLKGGIYSLPNAIGTGYDSVQSRAA